MPKKTKTSISGGGRGNGVGKKRPPNKARRPVENADAVTDLVSVIDSIPLYFTVRKPRSIAMVIGTRKAIVECLELRSEAEPASVAPIMEEANEPTQHQGLQYGETPPSKVKIEEGSGLEKPSNRVKIEEDDEETNSTTTTTTTITTTPTSTLATSSWLEIEGVLPGPIPELYSMYLDDMLPMDFLEDLPCY